MEQLDEALRTIEAALKRLSRAKLLGSLQPGLQPGRVRAVLKKSKLASDSQLEGLLAWRDGTETEGTVLGEIWLFPGFYMLSLEDAISNHRAFVHDQRWTPSWLPIFADGGGDFYFVDLAEPVSQVRRFRLEESEYPAEFDSIASMMMTVAAAYQQGVFYVDPQGGLEFDSEKFAILARDYNPTVDWWD